MNCFCLRGSDDLFSHLRPINLWGIVLILCHWDTFCASVMTTVSVLLKEDVKLGKIDDLSPLGPDLKIIVSDSVQIRDQLKRFSSISRCWTLGSPHWLAVNGSKTHSWVTAEELVFALCQLLGDFPVGRRHLDSCFSSLWSSTFSISLMNQ